MIAPFKLRIKCASGIVAYFKSLLYLVISVWVWAPHQGTITISVYKVRSRLEYLFVVYHPDKLVVFSFNMANGRFSHSHANPKHLKKSGPHKLQKKQVKLGFPLD